MSHQTVLTDGGIESAPKAQYDENRETYQYISNRLARTREVFETVGHEKRAELLRHSTEYAIISVQTNVENHEQAFVESRGVSDKQEMADIFADYVVQYHRNKSRYVVENRENVNFGEIADLLVHGYVDLAHEKLADECLGLGSAKAAFSISMLGYETKMCVDSHSARQAGLDSYASADTSIDEYESLSAKVYSAFPKLAKQTSRFLYQWVLFSTDRRDSGVDLHDPYYMVLENVAGSRLN